MPSNRCPHAPMLSGFASSQRCSRSTETHLLGAGRIHDFRQRPAESLVDAPREMVADVLADLRDVHLPVQREEDTEGLNRSQYVDRLAIALVQIGHRNPPRATAAHRANASNVAAAVLIILAVDAPMRGSPSSHATMTVHLGSVPSSSPPKNAQPSR